MIHKAARNTFLMGVVGCGLLTLASGQAFAQFSSVDDRAIPAFGGGTEYTRPAGGATINIPGEAGAPNLRPASPSAADINASLEFEHWSGEGVRFRSGDRMTALFNYTRGIGGDSELGFVLPFNRVRGAVTSTVGAGEGDVSGIGDLEIAFRKYKYNAEDPNGLTWVPGVRLFLPTATKSGVGLGEFAVGPSITVSKPLGGRTLVYAGASYTVVAGLGAGGKDIFQQWIGGVTAINPRWSVQYDVTHFNSIFDEDYTKIMIGPRLALTPTRGIQFNVQKELKADGGATKFSVGYSSRM